MFLILSQILPFISPLLKDWLKGEDWLKGVIIVIGKKGDTSVCGNNRGITLRSTASKLFQMILLKRLYMLVWSVFSGRISADLDRTAHVLIRFIPSAPLFITVLSLTFHYMLISLILRQRLIPSEESLFGQA